MLDQSLFVGTLIDQFNMSGCKSVSTPMVTLSSEYHYGERKEASLPETNGALM